MKQQLNRLVQWGVLFAAGILLLGVIAHPTPGGFIATFAQLVCLAIPLGFWWKNTVVKSSTYQYGLVFLILTLATSILLMPSRVIGSFRLSSEPLIYTYVGALSVLTAAVVVLLIYYILIVARTKQEVSVEVKKGGIDE